MKTFPEVFDKFRTTWRYEIKEIEDDPKVYALVEEYKGGEVDGSYVIVLDGGESRNDIVNTLQMAVLDTFTDEEKLELDKMFAVRKEVKALKGVV